MAGDRNLALITGAAGFVGSRIAHRFVREGMSVRALDQRPIDVAEVEFCVGDVTDPGVVRRATEGADLVVHCAAVISGPPDETMRVTDPLEADLGPTRRPVESRWGHQRGWKHNAIEYAAKGSSSMYEAHSACAGTCGASPMP